MALYTRVVIACPCVCLSLFLTQCVIIHAGLSVQPYLVFMTACVNMVVRVVSSDHSQLLMVVLGLP